MIKKKLIKSCMVLTLIGAMTFSVGCGKSNDTPTVSSNNTTTAAVVTKKQEPTTATDVVAVTSDGNAIEITTEAVKDVVENNSGNVVADVPVSEEEADNTPTQGNPVVEDKTETPVPAPEPSIETPSPAPEPTEPAPVTPTEYVGTGEEVYIALNIYTNGKLSTVDLCLGYDGKIFDAVEVFKSTTNFPPEATVEITGDRFMVKKADAHDLGVGVPAIEANVYVTIY